METLVAKNFVMSTLIANFGEGRVRHVTYNGREYLVAPMTTIVPGTLAGSQGPLYYPPDEIKSSVPRWDFKPITVDHPYDAGMAVSAKHPGIWERQGIGFLRNTQWKGKLVHEGWFDIEKTRLVDNRVLEALERGQQLELSTGLFTSNEVARGIDGQGRGYEFIARNYQPDHLAILPDKVGACSIRDGCGVLVNSSSGVEAVRKEVDKYTEDQLEGLRVWVNSDLGLAIIDRMDWYDKSGDLDPAAEIGKVAEKQWGKSRVVYQNEGASPHGRDWICLNSGNHIMPQLSFWHRLGELLGLVANAQAPDRSPAGQFAPKGAAKVKADAISGKSKDKEDGNNSNSLDRPDADEKTQKFDREQSMKAQLLSQQQAPPVGNRKPAFSTTTDGNGRDNPNEDKCPVCGKSDSDCTCPEGGLVDNPAVSEAQRRYLNSEFGHDWVKEHHFDNHGELPEKVDNANPEGHNQYTGGGLKGEIHKHLTENPRTKLDDLRRKFAKAEKLNKDDPLSHPVHAALKELRDEGRVKVHGGEWGEPSFSANHEGVNNSTQDINLTEGTNNMNWEDIISNMEGGGAFQGAKDAGYSASQAAAMAGKLEGTYEDAGRKSADALKKTKESIDKKTAGSHREASKAHRDAGYANSDAGHHEMAAYHYGKSAEHASKAGGQHHNKVVGNVSTRHDVYGNMARINLVPENIIANCTCKNTRAFLTTLNAKAEGSNADTTGGSGSVQTGGEETAKGSDTADDYESEDEFTDKVKVKSKPLSTNEWFAMMPVEAQGVWNTAKEVHNREYHSVVNQLKAIAERTTNPKQRSLIVNKVQKGAPLHELRQMLDLIGGSNQSMTGNQGVAINQGFLGTNPVAGFPADASFATNATDENDILPLPTMNYEEVARAE